MVLTDDVTLPSEKELTVQEITVSSPVLRAAALHLGIFCDKESKEYMLCKEEERDPRRCLNEGKALTSCGLKFFYKVKAMCKGELEGYARCLEWNSCDMHPRFCRKREAVYEQCMNEKMGLHKPPLGYFSSVRAHATDRPKPQATVPEFPDKTPGLPDNYPVPPSKHGFRVLDLP